MNIIARLFGKKQKTLRTDVPGIDPSWIKDPEVLREIQRIGDAKDTFESEQIVSELIKGENPRIKVGVALEVCRLGFTDHNSNIWRFISKLLADESGEVSRAIANIYWLREIEYKPHKMDPTGMQTPVKMAIFSLKMNADSAWIFSKNQAVKGLLCLVDCAPETAPHHLFDPVMGKYAHVANRGDIFNWEEVIHEMKKRIPNFL